MLDQITVQINGMTCNSCVNSIEQKISELDGVKSIKVSLVNKSAELEYDKDIISSSSLVEAIEDMGFEASLAGNEPNLVRSAFTVRGLKNDECVHKLESKFQNHPDVKSIKVSLKENVVRIIHDTSKMNDDDVCKYISELGFESEPISLDELSNSFVKINVEGMTCHSCVNNIEDFVGKKTGVKKIKVSLKDKVACVWFDPNVISSEEVRTVIDDMGFDASVQPDTEVGRILKSSIFEIQSVGDTRWTTDDEDSLFFTKGIISIRASRPNEVIVHYFHKEVDVNDIINVVQSMGFICIEKNPGAVLNNSTNSSPVTNVQHKASNEKSE